MVKTITIKTLGGKIIKRKADVQSYSDGYCRAYVGKTLYKVGYHTAEVAVWVCSSHPLFPAHYWANN